MFARRLAVLWLLLAVFILIGTYVSIPTVAGSTLKAVSLADGTAIPRNAKDGVATGAEQSALTRSFALVTLCAGITAIGAACFLLARSAFIEIELAVRYVSLADALCLTGSNLTDLEKLAVILVPKSRYLSASQAFSLKDLKALAEVVKQLKGLPPSSE